MSATLLDRQPPPARAQPLAGRAEPAPAGFLHRLRTGISARRRSAAWLTPLLVVAGLVHRVGMGGVPQRVDDEGTYTAQAYAVLQFGELAHYTYWYDHPPLGWLQIAAWTGLTGAFDRLDPSVLAGREAMLVAHLVSVALLWVLARRHELSRPAAGGAVLLYALSPLAVEFHRVVFLDNVATPWLLASFVLALSPKRQLAAFAGSAACFVVAVLTKETYLLLLPVLAWQLWRSADRQTRRYTLSVAASLFVLGLTAYLLFALLNSELLPGSNRVSLWQAVAYQLVERAGSGSVLDPDSLSRASVEEWLRLDPLLPIAGALAALASLPVRRLRPIAVAYLFLLAFMLRPGYLPTPYVIVLLPFAALLAAGAVDAGLRSGRRTLGVVAVTAGVVGTAVAIPTWGADLRVLMTGDLDRPLRQAQDWLVDNVPTDYRLLVDDAIWVDLVRAGFPRENVVWFYKPDTDPEVAGLSPRGWRDYDYLVSTQSLRGFSEGLPEVEQAVANSVPVAVFGEGSQRVEVRRVLEEGLDEAGNRRDRLAAVRGEAGTELAANPALQLTPAARDLLVAGRVDRRLLATLATAAAGQELTVADFPAQPGEVGTELPRRTVTVSAVAGTAVGTGEEPPVRELVRTLEQQRGSYAPQEVAVRDGALQVTFGVVPATAALSPVPR